ncbi:carboxymethylenebutenolidase homolog [Bradysia coprophila]|uniref:carboxymethylenebutenolidase homolog n=1 Tax=Bradysia coprophila TaxID=38358 RepID=UPI00187D98E7|nr:carboxymethylenebutenolidase homolog [Bradysia coprophila]XP_037045742.1 carboxymethylenebutenolidase homolog [Bradysia coprophila]
MVCLNLVILVTLSIVLARCHEMYDLAFVPHECIKNRAIAANYTPLGQVVRIGDLPVYEYEVPNNQNRSRMLVGVYDIYGFAYENLKQVMDQMAEQSGGFRVVMPDFYRGESANPDHTQAERQEWLARVGNWDTIVKPDLINVVDHYKNDGVREFAIFGFCWGGSVAMQVSIELADRFKASGLVHPSGVSNETAVNVQIPMYLMPAQNDADMSQYYEVLQTKFGDNCGHRRFTDMNHGFAGARGNFSDPLNRQRVDEVITTLGAFFDRNLNNSNNVHPSGILILALIISFFIARD